MSYIAIHPKELTFQIDVSRTYRNKEGYAAGGYKLNTSFETETHTPETFLSDVVAEGWPYTMAHLKRSPEETGAAARDVSTPKHIENFTSRQELTLDDDGRAAGSIAFWLTDPFFSRYGFAFVESVNSVPGTKEKGHPTIIFDRPITDPVLLKEAYKAMAFYYPRLDPLHNIDRTIYNAEHARVHHIGHICPLAVFEAELLNPYREHQAKVEAQREAEQAAKLAEWETAKAAGLLETGDSSTEKYIKATVDGILNWLATRTTGRHKALYSTGVLIGRLEAAPWTTPFGYRFAGIAAEVIAATVANGYFDGYAHTDREVLRTFNNGLTFGSTDPAPAPLLYRSNTGSVQNASGFNAPAKVEVKPYTLSDTAKARRDRILAEVEAKRAEAEAKTEARQAELERRFEAGNVIPFIGEDVDPDYIEYRRGHFSKAITWRDYVIEHWPDIDAEEQCQIKLTENREARPGKCGEYRKFTSPTGETVTRRHTCGICDDCLKRGVWIFNRALDEISGIAPEGYGHPPLDDIDTRPRENAPPLSVVHGDLSLVTVDTDDERIKLARELRLAGIEYRTQPLVWNDETRFDFLTNDDSGDPARLILTDERLTAWTRGVEQKRASGKLLPGLKALQKRYREALPYEVVMPELDDEGYPVDPDIFMLDLPDIGTSIQRLPEVAIDFFVTDADTLQAALYDINQKQSKILHRRGDVKYGVYVVKKMYTRYSTLDQMIEEFNTWQAQIRHKKGWPPLE